MKISFAVRRIAAGFVASVLAAGGAVGAATPPASAPTAAVAFPQDASALKADPDVRYGRLPNGFTYIIRKNTTPAGTAAVFLRIRAGSLMETEKQKGLAHFIEHMAFNGTTHIPEGDLKKILERHGFAFGADANAYTGEDKTVYTLFTPKTDAETLDTALFIMREIGGNMTLNTGAIDRERGVILGEERLRDTPGLHSSLAMNKWMFAGQKYADYASPIGSVDIIKTAPRSELAAFYNTWYRPELATLIVVGDFNPDEMEAKIKAGFGDWKGKGDMPAEPAWGQYAPQGIRAFTHQEKDLREDMTLSWIKPLDTRHDSVDKRVGGLIDGALLTALNRRFDNKMAEPGTAFLGAEISLSTAYKTGRVLTLYVVPRPGMARQSFEQAYDILHTFTAKGLTPHEIDDLIAVLDTTEKTTAAEDTTRNNSALAEEMLTRLDNDSVFVSTKDEISLLEALRPNITQASLNARIKTLFSGDGPALTHAGDALGDFDETELKADYQAVSSLSAATYSEKVRKPWPYTDFGPAAAPVSHTVDKDFGYGHYVYPNGVILNVKPTKLAANQVFVQVDFRGGMFRFDPKAKRPYPLADSSIFVGGGLGKMTENQYEETLYGKQFKVRYEMRDNSTVLTGITTPTDMPIQLQLLTAYATDPGYRQDGYNSVLSTVDVNLKSLKSSPLGVLAYNFDSIVRSGDPRYDETVLERVKDIRFDDITSILTESLKDTPIVVSVVGDVDEAQVVSEVGKTFGALPTRPAAAPKFPGADQMVFPPKQHEFTLYHEGRDDQSVSLAIWPTTGFYADTKDSRGLSILADIIENRLFDALREKQGADYSPTAGSNQDDDYPQFGYIQARATIKAGGDADFRTSLAKIVSDLKARPVSDDELLRVKKPIYESIDNSTKSNVYWITILPVVELYGDKARASQLNKRAEYDAVTADQVMQLARKYLNDDAVIHIKIIPAPKAAPAAPAAAKPAATKPASPAPKPVPAKPATLLPVAPNAVTAKPAPAVSALPKPIAAAKPASLVSAPVAATKPAAPALSPVGKPATKPLSSAPVAAGMAPAKPVSAVPAAPRPLAAKAVTVTSAAATPAKPAPAAPSAPKPVAAKPVAAKPVSPAPEPIIKPVAP